MHIIKLNAIGSTNTFLKEMVANSSVENYTVVVADSQFEGKGQMGSKWVSEPQKNLLFSVYVNDLDLIVADASSLNFVVSWVIYKVLNKYKIKRLAIKWPNDILAGHEKLCGILIENKFHDQKITSTVIGIGLNVNQQMFPEFLSTATSMSKQLNEEIDRNFLLKDIIDCLKKEIKKINTSNFSSLKERYLENLYLKDVPSMFADETGKTFLGKIIGINEEGNLLIELENENVKAFSVKQIKFLRS